MTEIEEKEEILQIPNLELAQWQFLVVNENSDYDPKLKKETLEKLMVVIKENQMAPFYRELCDELRTV